MRLAIVGTGYVGLVSGVCFAEMGNDVICVDIDAQKVARMKAGEMPIYEPGLDHYFERNRVSGRLTFTTYLADAVAKSTIIFLALPTPPGEDGSADLSYVMGVAEQIGPMLDSYKIIVDKSTVPVGTADLVAAQIAKSGKQEGVDFDVVSNPEFLREGVAVDDFMKPERVVIGTSSERAGQTMHTLYEPFVRQGNPIIIMDERSAEMTKYAANAMLATKITFMNEIANLCDLLGANVEHVRRGVGTDSRIGRKFLYPGLGFGGSCFPKDVKALRKTAGENGYDFQILNAVLNVNDQQHTKLTDRLVKRFGGSLEGRHIAVWGLAFKANTDDIRESPAHRVVREILDAGGTVAAFDPEATETTKVVFGDQITYAANKYDALNDADALFICTEWALFRTPDWPEIQSKLKAPLVYDGRNLYNPQRMAEQGFEYYSVGRPYPAAEQPKG
ncbi:MAG: UDP-glucose/GDP-mannose dehydrogenase family protein [Bacteroidota bacterium]